MKAILEFNLPEDSKLLQLAKDATAWYNVVWNLSERVLRSQLKYNDTLSDDYRMALEAVREELYQIMSNNGVDFGE